MIKSFKFSFAICCIVFSVSSNLYSQKCIFSENKKDAFTGKLMRSTKSEVLFHSNDIWGSSSLKRTDNEYTLVIVFSMSGEIKDIIPAGTQIFLKTDKSSI